MCLEIFDRAYNRMLNFDKFFSFPTLWLGTSNLMNNFDIKSYRIDCLDWLIVMKHEQV